MRSEFLSLYLVETMDLEPVPEEGHLNGRFIKSAIAAGCKGRVSIRSRMITGIASTKYKTTDGAPMSLITLHGKDDMLVLGPDWAIEKLASGEPEPVTIDSHERYLRKVGEAIESAECEAAYLAQIPALLRTADVQNSEDPANQDLRMFFRTHIAEIDDYFKARDIEVFVGAHREEVQRHLTYLRALQDADYKYPYWWLDWEDFSITASGRHIQGYPVSSDGKMHNGRKRGEFKVLQKECAAETPGSGQ